MSSKSVSPPSPEGKADKGKRIAEAPSVEDPDEDQDNTLALLYGDFGDDDDEEDDDYASDDDEGEDSDDNIVYDSEDGEDAPPRTASGSAVANGKQAAFTNINKNEDEQQEDGDDEEGDKEELDADEIAGEVQELLEEAQESGGGEDMVLGLRSGKPLSKSGANTGSPSKGSSSGAGASSSSSSSLKRARADTDSTGQRATKKSN
ncbi:uncharacterized protein EV422DRAFT_189489 [Fimicolochytrium jonesii]|uniref:uncharacterized protein n=1 Tax=Fimicolochytrium jonesii TaxID=1396493 RepID=UPI0022FF4414|nr:uncharacterized protein EV422DRAFT_189489 [Fimicolochytrium jonesii]KAI8818094.1 hypothetical protein EV422DRAFT_189489 [Fimicolochytrium jonesii]